MRIGVPNVKGLLPAIDPKKSNQPFCLDGENFYCDVNGPRSGFGRTSVTDDAFEDATYVQSIEVDGDEFVFTSSVALKYSVTARDFLPLYTYTPITNQHAWTSAHVGTKYFFCHPDVGLLSYDLVTNVWNTYSGGSYPSNMYACTASAGRLIILALDVVAWSSIDDGTDVVPSTTTGAGFQLLAILGKGTPLSIQSVADGYLAFTE